MIAVDEPALICDFAEIYGILDYRELPARRAALLACGLGDRSRIARKISGAPAEPEIFLLAGIADALNLLVWQNTKDGRNGRNRPASILERIIRPEAGEDAASGFESAEDFDAWRASMMGGE